MEKLIIANWKAHPETLAEGRVLYSAELALAEKYASVKTVICPPVEMVKELSEIDSKHLGSQDVFWQPDEDNYGVRYVLVGHSDRRYPSSGAGDTNEVINAKIRVALASKATPILLVGERNKGDDRELVLSEQLSKSLSSLSPDELGKILICYEPVWAISRPAPEIAPAFGKLGQVPVGISDEFQQKGNLGSGTFYHSDTPENILIVATIIKQITGAETILYGGSVNSQNVADFLQHSEISGVVVGEASLDATEFENILQVVSK
ncbi:MAG: hypothetical protein A3F25_02955 [Candidatus Yanofskybacteria bacterium RIFCSPHIGHO2_12_FULL_45_19b]|uniref:Triosephosphate isomerase n=1 Tax=Candidatus Yanofskybacteria bacterium RIFCSPHIGHO2_12_FULL_45_19b TaxID=1802689 RepID=A0A1F8G3E4_9BACT|nr:MAG: hypothetical protein A3F25_02955 [Candidatus Yanofskybacteria bacterium RIFCSPHIGHO2_12_FULL_45_19b]